MYIFNHVHRRDIIGGVVSLYVNVKIDFMFLIIWRTCINWNGKLHNYRLYLQASHLQIILFKYLADALSLLSKEGKERYLVSDYNLLNVSDVQTQYFLDAIFSYCYKPVQSKPKWIMERSATNR